MPRKPRKSRVLRPPALSEAWRAFFETGAGGKGTPDHVEIFLAEKSGQSMLAAWLPHREKFLAEWKRENRKGLPWIEKQLKEELKDEKSGFYTSKIQKSLFYTSKINKGESDNAWA